MRIKKCFLGLCYLMLMLIGVWILASFIDTNLHNNIGTGYQNFSKWNLFNFMC